MRRPLLLLALVGIAVLPSLAFAQDASSLNPVTMGRGPEEGTLVPAWIFYWVLGVGTVISTALVGALKVLWSKVDSKIAPGLTPDERTWLRELYDMQSAKAEDGVPWVYARRTLASDLAKLVELAQNTRDSLETLGDSKKDRQDLRAAFEAEKSQMRLIFSEEIKALQAQLNQEQKERREDTQQLWNKNDATTREVMTVIRDMIVALENASNVIEQWNEANPEG